MASSGLALTQYVYAFIEATNAPKTGDAANIAVRLLADGTEATPAGTVTEADATNLPGVYKVALTGAENTGFGMLLGGKSSTGGVAVLPTSWTNEKLPTAAPGATNGLLISGANTGPLSVSGGVTFSNTGAAFTLTSSGDDAVFVSAANGSVGINIDNGGMRISAGTSHVNALDISNTQSGINKVAIKIASADDAIDISSQFDGIFITAASGSALNLQGHGSNPGVIITGGNDAVVLTAGTGTNGKGLSIIADGTGAGIAIATDNASGIDLASVIGGNGLNGTLSASAVNSILDLADSVETGLTVRQAMRAGAAADAGTLSGAGTVTQIINGAGTTTPRITATVDPNGNRQVIDLSL